ncbi:MAG: alpha/beta fold hydrolase, partial [Myxococcota bacterium]
VILKGTPPIPAALRERMRQYNHARSAWVGDLAPDGNSMVVTTRFGQTSQAHVVARPRGARSQITFRDEPVRGPRFDPRDPNALLFMSDTGGDEQYQIYRLDRTRGTTVRLTDGTSRHGGYVWSDDGAQIAFTNNARNGKDMDLYLGDGRTPASATLLLEREGHWYPIGFSRDRQKLLVGHYVSINDSRLHLVDIPTKSLTRLSPDDEVASYRNARLSPDGKTAYVASDRAGEFNQLYALDVASQRFTALTSDIPWNVEDMVLSPDGKTLAFVVNEDGYGPLYLLDTRTGRHRQAPGIPRGIVSGLRYSRQDDTLAFTLTGPAMAGDAYRYLPRTGALERWTESEIGGLDPKRFVEPKLIRYPTFDGRQIPAFVYRPPNGASSLPVVIWIHGGPESQARPSFNPLLQYLVREAGFAVVVPNVRGSNGYGKSYLLLDNGEKREDSVKDIGALLDWIGTRPGFDPTRVGVFGGSYGGYMVLASLVHFGARIKAGVDIVGISNFVTFLENTKDYRRDLRRAEYGDERDPEMRRFLETISPS